MNAISVIEKKRDGLALSEEEIFWLIQSYTEGTVPDYQMAAWCMAVYFTGMTAKETEFLTKAMAASGKKADLSAIPGVKVDKHSTGGVGDTVTLIAAPIAAAAGVPIAKMSGRSLGFTGGTADKLSAIPGYRTEMTHEDFIRQVRDHGVALIAQTGEGCPADSLLYALRDSTGTVESLPLIASSIMSKKFLSGANALVLDVKCGNGAFMKDQRRAEALMDEMLAIAQSAGLRTIAFLTDMNVPLGTAIGNAVEVDEAAEVLLGGGGRRLRQLSLTMAGAMIWAGKKASSLVEGRALAETLLTSGQALDKWNECIASQGGDTSWIGKHPLAAAPSCDVYAAKGGWITAMDPMALAHIVMDMGGGRIRKEDTIDLSAGIRFWKEPGDAVKAGEKLCTLYGKEGLPMDDLACRAEGAVEIGKEQNVFPLVYRMKTADI